MKQETYKAARERLLRELAALGWETKPSLKVPQAIPPGREYTLFFKTQAVYKNAHSMWLDIRNFSTEQFVQECNDG